MLVAFKGEGESAMEKKLILLVALGLAAMPALARKDCEELKAEIEAKMAAKNVGAHTLKIVNTGEEQGAKVVGSCDGGAKKITYTRDASDKPKKE
jgi:hypothetical protein